MKVYIANYQPERIGGGWTFARNFADGIDVSSYEESDVYFITSASMVRRNEVEQAKRDGKKIVLRVDNVLRNSRNRNSGMSRMKSMAEMADIIIYQSQWAKDFLNPFLETKNPKVILNGINLDVFKPPHTFHYGYENNYLYSRYNRDEGKNWQSAWYYFYFKNLENPNNRLFITGQFSPELRENNFDFFNNEHFRYLGVLNEMDMALLYKQCKYFIYTYSFDACSNSLIEALCSGCKVVGDKYYRDSGGAKEIIHTFKELGRDYFSKERMCQEYREALQ